MAPLYDTNEVARLLSASDNAKTSDAKGDKLEETVKTDAELGLDVVPKGLALTDGNAQRTVQFKDGKMVGDPPRFSLQAPPRNETTNPADWGVYVFFSRNRAQLYSHFIPIRLVDQFAEGVGGNLVVDLDLAQVGRSRPEPRDATVSVSKDGGNWRIHWDIDGYQSRSRLTKVDTAALKDQGDCHRFGLDDPQRKA